MLYCSPDIIENEAKFVTSKVAINDIRDHDAIHTLCMLYRARMMMAQIDLG